MTGRKGRLNHAALVENCLLSLVNERALSRVEKSYRAPSKKAAGGEKLEMADDYHHKGPRQVVGVLRQMSQDFPTVRAREPLTPPKKKSPNLVGFVP
jgi:hypothetical protein